MLLSIWAPTIRADDVIWILAPPLVANDLARIRVADAGDPSVCPTRASAPANKACAGLRAELMSGYNVYSAGLQSPSQIIG